MVWKRSPARRTALPLHLQRMTASRLPLEDVGLWLSNPLPQSRAWKSKHSRSGGEEDELLSCALTVLNTPRATRSSTEISQSFPPATDEMRCSPRDASRQRDLAKRSHLWEKQSTTVPRAPFATAFQALEALSLDTDSSLGLTLHPSSLVNPPLFQMRTSFPDTRFH